VLATALRELRDWKSAYYQDALISRTTDQVPIFDIQGWTDNLFPEVEGVSFVNKLRADGWPVKVAVADVGHPAAQNKAAVWSVLNSEANAFLDHYMLGTGSSITFDSSAQLTSCNSSAGTTYTKNNWTSLAPHRITFTSTDQKATTSATPGDTLQASTDPIAVAAQHGGNGACIVLPASSSVPAANWDFPVTTPFTLLGEPALHLAATVAGTDAEIDALLWDVAPDGTKTLVTRGAYRFTGSPGAATIDTPLQGNGWAFAPGHVIRLEVTQNDASYLRPDNFPSAVVYSSVRLTLPTPTVVPSGSGSPTTEIPGGVTVLAQTGGA
jgi:predicted acyl esterase